MELPMSINRYTNGRNRSSYLPRPALQATGVQNWPPFRPNTNRLLHSLAIYTRRPLDVPGNDTASNTYHRTERSLSPTRRCFQIHPCSNIRPRLFNYGTTHQTFLTGSIFKLACIWDLAPGKFITRGTSSSEAWLTRLSHVFIYLSLTFCFNAIVLSSVLVFRSKKQAQGCNTRYFQKQTKHHYLPSLSSLQSS